LPLLTIGEFILGNALLAAGIFVNEQPGGTSENLKEKPYLLKARRIAWVVAGCALLLKEVSDLVTRP